MYIMNPLGIYTVHNIYIYTYYEHIYMYVYAYIYIYMQAYIYIYMTMLYIYACIYIYIHMYIYIYPIHIFRFGFWRVLDMLSRHGIAATLVAAPSVLRRCPALVRAGRLSTSV